MQILKKGLVSGSWPREKTCFHCTAIVSCGKEDLFAPEQGKIAFICPECGRTQLIKDVLHIDDEAKLLSLAEFIQSRKV